MSISCCLLTPVTFMFLLKEGVFRYQMESSMDEKDRGARNSTLFNMSQLLQ